MYSSFTHRSANTRFILHPYAHTITGGGGGGVGGLGTVKNYSDSFYIFLASVNYDFCLVIAKHFKQMYVMGASNFRSREQLARLIVQTTSLVPRFTLT